MIEFNVVIVQILMKCNEKELDKVLATPSSK